MAQADRGGALLAADEVRAFDEADLVLFVGIDTAGSAVHRELPVWAPALGLDGVVLRGVDLPVATSDAAWRDLLGDLAANPRVRGAVVTSHKLRLFRACGDLFAGTDLAAALMREASTLAVHGGEVRAYARDVVALDSVLASVREGGVREVVCLGCGGAATALLLALVLDVDALLAGRVEPRPGEVPSLTFADLDAAAVAALLEVADRTGVGRAAVRGVVTSGADEARALVEAAGPGSVVVNATGLGKLGPASPLPDATRFAPGSLAWDFNYRGPLTFLAQAGAQGAAVLDGRDYYLAGWAGALAALAGLEPREAIRRVRDVAAHAPGPQGRP